MTHPIGWQEVKLGDIANITMGQSPKSEFYNKENNGLPFLQGSSTFGYTYPTFDIYSSDIKKIAKNGSILMSVRAPVGDINIANTDICIGRGLCSINANNKSINNYIFYILKYYKNNLLNNQKGTTFGSITKDDIINLNLIIPPLNEQKRIAEILSICDDYIENLSKLIEKKEQYKKGVMQKVLSGEVRFKGFKDEWKILKLKEIGNIISGNGFPIKYQGKQFGEIAFIKVSDMNLKDNYIFIKKANNYIDENDLKELKAKIIPIGSIVFAKIGEAIKLERKRIISIKTCIDNNMSALVPFDNFNKKYIFYLLNDYKLSKHLNFSALPSLNMADILDAEFLIPSLDEQKKIASLLNAIDEDIDNLKKELELRKQQKKGLMQKLLTGEVRV